MEEPKKIRAAEDPREALARRAAGRRAGLLREVWHWLRVTRKWWLVPLLLCLLVLGFFLVVASTGAGPLLYTLF